MLKSDNLPPIVVPWPHMVSRTGVTVSVASSARINCLARRDSEDSRVVWFVAPGLEDVKLFVLFHYLLSARTHWKLYSWIPSSSQRFRSSKNDVYACLAFAGSSWARFTKYEPCGRIYLKEVSIYLQQVRETWFRKKK